jgi:hypothetical protein
LLIDKMAVTFTDGVTAGVVTKDAIPQLGIKILSVRVPVTFLWGTDLLAIDLTRYGCSTLAGVVSFEETTLGSIVVNRACTTAVVTGVATITSTAGGEAREGTFIIFAY